VQELFLKRVKVQNFKSFADVDLELERLNVVVGANAAGKSNLVSVFGFLRDLCRSGLDGAVSAQGGPRYVGNPRLEGKSTVVELEVKAPKTRVRVPGRRRVYSTGGRWRLEFMAGGEKAEMIEDSWAFDVCEQRTQAGHAAAGDGRNRPEYSNADREGTVSATRDGAGLRLETDLGGCLRDELGRCAAPDAGGKLIVESGLLGGFFPWLPRFEDIGAYNFSRAAGICQGPGGGGSDLVQVLKRTLADGESRKRLHALVSEMLPSVKSVGAEDFARSVEFAAAGKPPGKEHPPPLSDGIVSAAVVVASMYFGDMPVVAIEEPEKSIHPSLMARTVDMARDASRQRQIIMTTHSSEIVRHAGTESLYAIKKAPGGFSEICRPSANKEIAQFLENGVGLAEMHMQNMLER